MLYFQLGLALMALNTKPARKNGKDSFSGIFTTLKEASQSEQQPLQVSKIRSDLTHAEPTLRPGSLWRGPVVSKAYTVQRAKESGYMVHGFIFEHLCAGNFD